jgi:YD repeat-containing protein
MVPSNDPNALHHPGPLSFAGSRASLNLGSYAYDGAGNVTSIGTDLFAYDRVSRLTEADLQGQAASQGYGFDSFGNLTSITTTKTDATGSAHDLPQRRRGQRHPPVHADEPRLRPDPIG